MNDKPIDETLRCHQIPIGLSPSELAPLLRGEDRDLDYRLAEYPRNSKTWIRLPFENQR